MKASIFFLNGLNWYVITTPVVEEENNDSGPLITKEVPVMSLKTYFELSI